MKIASDMRTTCFLLGFLFFWIALSIVMFDFYAGLVQATITTTRGGTYTTILMTREHLLYFIFTALASSSLLAVGLGSEVKQPKVSKET